MLFLMMVCACDHNGIEFQVRAQMEAAIAAVIELTPSEITRIQVKSTCLCVLGFTHILSQLCAAHIVCNSILCDVFDCRPPGRLLLRLDYGVYWANNV